MAALIWKHGKTPDEVREVLQSRLNAAGVSDKVVWNGDAFTSSVGWGTILKINGEIQQDQIVLSRVSGVIGGVVLAKSREAFEQLFPGGEASTVDESQHAEAI